MDRDSLIMRIIMTLNKSDKDTKAAALIYLLRISSTTVLNRLSEFLQLIS